MPELLSSHHHRKNSYLPKGVKFYLCFIVETSKQFSNLHLFGRKEMSKKKEKFNVTQGMTLLLLKKLSLPANVVFIMILFITNPANEIGYENE